MAGEIKIRKGSRLRLALDNGSDKEPQFNLITTFIGSVDESAFLVSVPMVGGKSMNLDENQRLIFMYQNGDNGMFLAGYADDEEVDGIHHYWRIRRVDEHRHFFKRNDERMKVCLRIKYTQDTWSMVDGVTERLDGMTMDISAGGIATYLNHKFDVGETCKFFLPHVGTTSDGEAIEDIVGIICWMREAPKGSYYHYIAGVQYRFADGPERDRMRAYVATVKKKFKLQ